MAQHYVTVTPNTEITINVSPDGHMVIGIEERDPKLVAVKVIIPPEWIGRTISRGEILAYVQEGLSQGLVERMLFPGNPGSVRLDERPDLLAEVNRDLDQIEASFARGREKP